MDAKFETVVFGEAGENMDVGVFQRSLASFRAKVRVVRAFWVQICSNHTDPRAMAFQKATFNKEIT